MANPHAPGEPVSGFPATMTCSFASFATGASTSEVGREEATHRGSINTLVRKTVRLHRSNSK